MTTRWEQVEQLFDRVVNAPVEQRASILAAATAPDAIKTEVQSLLQAHDRAGGFLDGQAWRADTDAGLPSAVDMRVPAADEYAPGQAIGPYVIKRVAGRGGMGIVYEAEDTRLHRRVALKALPAEAAAEDAQRLRLRHEARAAAALQHPNIAVVYALEEIDDRLFIATEYLDGATLRAEMTGPLPIAQALDIASTLARALCAAHERGIVHRDLKPENVVRTRDGVLKILDFGLAQFEAGSDLASRTRLTQHGMLVGTPAYMAPEQLLGRPTDFRVDQFALGVLLYEMCVGRHPFGSRSLPSVIARILAADPEPPLGVAQAPSPVWALIERLLAKDPAGRFDSTRELATALEAAAVQSAAPAQSAAPLRPSVAPPLSQPLTWWRFHQVAAALGYGAMVWPLWHAHRTLGEISRFIFFASLTAVVVAAILRLHLWFSSHVYPDHLLEQRRRAAPWILGADVLFCLLLIGVGMALREQHAGWTALFIGAGVSSAVAFLFIEPATTRAAFR